MELFAQREGQTEQRCSPLHLTLKAFSDDRHCRKQETWEWSLMEWKRVKFECHWEFAGIFLSGFFCSSSSSSHTQSLALTPSSATIHVRKMKLFCIVNKYSGLYILLIVMSNDYDWLNDTPHIHRIHSTSQSNLFFLFIHVKAIHSQRRLV